MQVTSFIDNNPYLTEKFFLKTNPFTGEKLHQVNSADLMGLVKAVQSGNAAFADWKNSSLDERTRLLQNIKQRLLEKSNEYAAMEALDQGLSLQFVQKNSIDKIIENIDQIVNLKTSPDSHVQYMPVGVISIISSWNLSLRVIMDRLLPSLMAGNAVVVKVSSQSPVTAFVLSEILLSAGMPKGLVNIIVSEDTEVKRSMVIHPGIKAVSFAGSLGTASEVLPLAGGSALQAFKKIQISSGSKNTAVVLTEPEDRIFSQVINSFVLGQGQLVWNSARLFILEKYEKEWVERIKLYLADLRPSQGIEDNSPWTPCVKSESFVKFDEIKKISLSDQAKLLSAEYKLSEQDKSKYLPVTFTQDMSRCSTLQQDQINSPFFILSSVKYPFDIPKYSNVSYYGFAAHLYGETTKLSKVAEALEVGLVTYNKFSVEECGAIGGVKQSGFGIQDFRSFGAFYSNVKKLTS